MLNAKFTGQWKSLVSENKIYRFTTPALTLCLLISVMGWTAKEKTVVLIPPELNEQVEISNRQASGAYKKSWALFVSSMLGNINPGNADFVVEAVGPVIDSTSFEMLKRSVAEDIEMIKRDGVSVVFESKSVIYEPSTDKLFVVGQTRISGTTGVISKFERVFEMMISIEGGMPKVKNLDSYVGKPRTTDILLKMKNDAAIAAQRAAAAKGQ